MTRLVGKSLATKYRNVLFSVIKELIIQAEEGMFPYTFLRSYFT